MSLFYRKFVEGAERWPSATAVEVQRPHEIERHTYADMRRMAESVGSWLREQAIERGSRCAILADNGPRWVASYLGTLAHGCVAVPLDATYHSDQVEKLLRDSGATVVFADQKHWATAQKASQTGGQKLVAIDPGNEVATPGASAGLDAIFSAGPRDFVPAEVNESELAILLYTSGTTADPKGVMLSHGNIAAETKAIHDFINIGPGDAILGILPLFHALAQVANLLMPLECGVRAVFLETLNTTELLRALRERDITAFCTVPQFFYLIHERIFKEIGKRGKLAEKALRGLMALNRTTRRVGVNLGPVFFSKVHDTIGRKMRFFVTGGSRFDPAIARDFYALGVDVMQAYGLTETTGGAVVTPPKKIVIGSTGKPLPGVEVKTLDPQPQEEGGTPIGEVLIRGRIVMQGYYNRPDATAETLRDGWLHTGDLGYFDAQGNLVLTGRKKEMIILANGKNLYPEEIEAHYLKSPFIKELCVMGMQGTPGDPQSERLHAVIVPNFEVLRERKILNAKEVIRWDLEGLSQELPSVKRIRSYDIWQEELPRTTTRKLKRFEIERRVKERQARGISGVEPASQKELTEEEALWLDQPKVQRALEAIRENARETKAVILPGDNLELDLGLDSMQRIELLVAVEGELGGKVDESRIGEIYTVRELVDAVLASAVEGRARETALGWDAIFREEVTDPEVLHLAKSRTIATAFWFLVSRIAQMLANDLFHLRVTGLEKLPEKGPFILSSNHQSYIDPVVLGAVMPWKHFRNLFAVGTSEIFGSGFMHWLAHQLHVVVVDPDINLVPAMKAGAWGLRRGMVLVLYPEGERSIDGTPKRFKKGAAILATHLKVPIVPIAIEGFYDAWPRGKSFFQKITRMSMAIGDPIAPPEGPVSEKFYEQFMAKVKARVVEMYDELGVEYRGDVLEAKAAD
jgi:long-chain acyl-CoA synthetase